MRKFLPLLFIGLLSITACSKKAPPDIINQNPVIAPPLAAGTVITVAGTGLPGVVNGNGTGASFNEPTGLTVDTYDYVTVAEQGNSLIRIINPYAAVTTLAGSGKDSLADGTGASASFRFPADVAVDAKGDFYIADTGNDMIRKMTAAGVVTTLAGGGPTAPTNGTGTAASFNSPLGVAVDASGNVYVADQGNNLIREISPAGVVTTLAGSGAVAFANGTGTAASFNSPLGVAVDASGNVYVADQGNNLIREISPAGVVTTLAGSGTARFDNGTGTAASFNAPNGVAVDASGNVYVADLGNRMIRKITQGGVVTTFAGGPGGAAIYLKAPASVAVDANGNVYVADEGTNLISMITQAGVATTLAGSGISGFTNAVGTAASFSFPTGVAVDSKGNVYVADRGNNAIRRISSGK